MRLRYYRLSDGLFRFSSVTKVSDLCKGYRIVWSASALWPGLQARISGRADRVRGRAGIGKSGERVCSRYHGNHVSCVSERTASRHKCISRLLLGVIIRQETWERVPFFWTCYTIMSQAAWKRSKKLYYKGSMEGKVKQSLFWLSSK